MLSKKRFYNSKEYSRCLFGKSGNNNILVLAALIIISVIIIFLIWHYWSAGQVSDAATEQEHLEKWARDSLKSEYVPDEVEANTVLKIPIGAVNSREENLRLMTESSWNINNENFNVQISYNKDNRTINYYATTVYYPEKISLDKNYALVLLYTYFKLPESDLSLNCDQESNIEYCMATIEDTVKKDFLVSYLEIEDITSISIAYLERPKESESYEKENIWI